MKILTYYEPGGRCPAMDMRLLLAWRAAWKDKGWEPQVLTRYHAMKHSAYRPEVPTAPLLAAAAVLVNQSGVLADYTLFPGPDYGNKEVELFGGALAILPKHRMIRLGKGLVAAYGRDFAKPPPEVYEVQVQLVYAYGYGPIDKAEVVDYVGHLEQVVPQQTISWPVDRQPAMAPPPLVRESSSGFSAMIRRRA